MVKSVSCCCVRGSRLFSDLVTYVIRGLINCLLGLPAINALHQLQRIEPVAKEEPGIRTRFESVFTGLGTIGDEYCISLKEEAKPYSLHTPRNVLILLKSKMESKLNCMEMMRVISKVDEPTSWFVGMVVVPKKSGAVRICVDLKPLNESMLRVVHPIPTVDETFAQLSGATVFSKLDANSDFWQIPSAKESRPFTAFITQMGRYFLTNFPLTYQPLQNCSKKI